MNIAVKKEKILGLSPQEAIDEYATMNLEITIDDSLPLHTQQGLVIHAVIENYCLAWTHDKVDELGELIIGALGELG